MKGMEKAVEKRWQDRVLPNRWHLMGEEGALEYLRKYGKNIGLSKLKALREHARKSGFPEFARGLEVPIVLRKL